MYRSVKERGLYSSQRVWKFKDTNVLMSMNPRPTTGGERRENKGMSASACITIHFYLLKPKRWLLEKHISICSIVRVFGFGITPSRAQGPLWCTQGYDERCRNQILQLARQSPPCYTTALNSSSPNFWFLRMSLYLE